ncbi:hypothetical protein SAMN05660776_0630 [Salegentibacter holothuriorum]|uniref:20S proteasome, alpha and beta subunits n=1 Tax=Salegentibacter holothuriorum TaxID=241145 RepID=A0A1T5AJQ4_9FLAO|nr:hypothetical protein [Salegentibacter holothuriorum]SKB35120.1 hypothetical protein SAMN05660776_0630 [Salegentibacter holothuriorum]
MTLVIAQKKNKKISFASDSRISFGNQGHIDFGIKIFSVPVKIYSPTDSNKKTKTLDYDHTIGLAVIGSAVNAYLIKESINEILQNLQYAPTWSDISMDKIANLVFKIYKKTTADLTKVLQKGGVCELILGGYCPKQNKIKVFKYYLDLSNSPYTPEIIEILIDEGSIDFSGSGKIEAEKMFKSDKKLIPLKILRSIVNNPDIKGVGGGLQYGEFKNRNFEVLGVEDYSTNPDNSFKEYLLTLRGITLYKGEFESKLDDFHIAYNFITPFKDEIDNAFKIGIDNI